MADLTKVIKGLECCVFPVSKGFPYQSHIADKGCEVIECPYRDDCDQLLLDALELLKAREQTTAKEDWDGLSQCNKCGGSLGYTKSFKFCPWCGRAVKWDDQQRSH